VQVADIIGAASSLHLHTAEVHNGLYTGCLPALMMYSFSCALAVILHLLVAIECVVVPTCPPQFYSQTVGKVQRCCKLCPAGTYLAQHCTERNESVCNPCPKESFTEQANNYRKCIGCTKCTGNLYLKKECTKTADSDCRCISGYFYKSFSNTCEKCENCSVGEGVVVDCSHNSRRICQSCQKGVTFSDKINGKCDPCTQCKVKEVKISNCTVDQNTKCKPATQSKPQSENTKYIIGTVTVVVVMVMILLIVGVLVFRKRAVINCCAVDHPTVVTTIDRVTVPSKPSNSTGTPEETVALRVSMNPPDKFRGKTIDEVSYGDKEELAKLLDPSTLRHKNWRTLAGLLSYNQIDIENFEGSDSPTLRVFLEYSTQKDCTVQRLYNAFLAMKRQDCIRILKSYCSDSSEV